MPPISVMKIETTIAKIGRSMKKCDSFIVLPALIGVGFGRNGSLLRRDLGAGTRPHQSIDNDAISWQKYLPDDAKPVMGRPWTDDLRHDRVVVRDRHDDLT